ncbi:MAG: hypothetical protein AAF223_01065 [Bacteroidota bacterium]
MQGWIEAYPARRATLGWRSAFEKSETDISREDADKLEYWFGRPDSDSERAQVEIIYSLIYGERWITKGVAAIPEALPGEDVE